MTTPVADSLRKVRALLSEASAWTPDEDMRDVHGKATHARWLARQWSVVGAVGATLPKYGPDYVATVEALIAGARIKHRAAAYVRSRLVPVNALMDWESAPERTHADVLAMLDRAIAQEESDK